MESDKYSFYEKFIVRTSLYDMLKHGGVTMRDDERGVAMMLEYFSEHFTREL